MKINNPMRRKRNNELRRQLRISMLKDDPSTPIGILAAICEPEEFAQKVRTRRIGFVLKVLCLILLVPVLATVFNLGSQAVQAVGDFWVSDIGGNESGGQLIVWCLIGGFIGIILGIQTAAALKYLRSNHKD